MSLFSDLNNLTDLATRDEYHNMLGYTQEELEAYFAPHLRHIAQKQGVPMEKLLADIKEWYNGFSWNGQDNLYNPFSILNFMGARAFHNFWIDSGTPKFLIELLKKDMAYDVSGKTVAPISVNKMDIDRLSYQTILFQAGYVSVREINKYGHYVLAYPNKEVEQAMYQYILMDISEDMDTPSLAGDLALSIETHDMELLQKTVNTLFASVPYQLFDAHRERYFHALLFLALRLCGLHIQAEVSVATGRVDAVLQYENRVYVFEFKLNAPAEEALNQIREKGYHPPYLGQGKEVYLVGISFSGEKKAVGEVKVESEKRIPC